MPLILALVATLALLLAGCGSQEADSAATGTGKSADLSFAATTLDGASFDGRSLEGTPTVLWWWAPWCPTCRAQSGNVVDLARTYEGEVAVVGVGGLDTAGAIADLAAELPHITHLVDDQGEVWRHFGVTTQSTYTVISAEGEIIAEGYLDDAELNDLVANLAGEPA